MVDQREAIERLRSLLNEVLEESRSIRFDSGKTQHLVAVALHGTIVEYGGGILELLRAGNATSAFVVLRSALEAFVDLAATIESPEYPRHIHLEFLAQNRKILKNALKDQSENLYLRSLREHPDSSSQLKEFDDQIAALEVEGVKRLSVRERFERSGQLDLYVGPYALLCQHSHNNLGALERRHIKSVDGRFEAYYFQVATNHDVQLIIDTLAGFAANSLASLVILTTGANPPELPEVTAKLSHLRELWRSWPSD